MPRTSAPRGGPWVALSLGLLCCWSCAAPGPAPGPPVAIEAQQALARAVELRESGLPTDGPEIWSELQRATREAPDWVSPQRLEDDLLGGELRSVEALERRRQDLSEHPGDARAMYLVARLEGKLDATVFGRIVQADPGFAWAHHALAWSHSLKGESAAALDAWERALDLARCPGDRAYFADRVSRYLLTHGEDQAARDLLLSMLSAGDLSPAESIRLAAKLALLELESSAADLQRVGYARGLELLHEQPMAGAQLRPLVAKMMEVYSRDDPGRTRLEAALLGLPSPNTGRWLASLWIRQGRTELAREFGRSSDDPGVAALLERLDGFNELVRQGLLDRAVNNWLATLPEQVLGEDGLPRDPALHAMVASGRGLGANLNHLEELVIFGESLMEAGWYSSAAEVAGLVVALDLNRGLDLRRRAIAGVVLFRRLQILLRDVEKDRKEIEVLAGVPVSPAKSRGSLDDLLRRYGLAFAQTEANQGRSTSRTAQRALFADSPILSYGPVARLVHPGPFYSAADEAAGRGKQGAPVPGLAHFMAGHGRFAILGEALGGGGPDATVLRRVLVEERSGEHLGVAWTGTVAWCDGADVKSRVQRGDQHIAGAAVHEGYWIDLAELRSSFSLWTAVGVEFDGDPSDEDHVRRLDRALGTRGLRLRAPHTNPRTRQRERVATSPTLGAADRMRLTILRERATPGRLTGELEFSELVELTATHEEGHLCERTRFLPVLRRFFPLFLFGLEQAFSPSAIRARLEYRAELVALCEIPDPRMGLVNLLGAASSRADSGLGHGPAYRQLLGDLLESLDRELERDPAAWPELSADHTLLHQLHHLPPKKIRRLAVGLARAEGLTAPGFKLQSN